MATGLNISMPHDRAMTTGRPIGGWLHEHVPWRTVVAPWLVAHVIVSVAMRLPSQPAGLRFGRLILLDGQWFQQIATRWYDGPYTPGLWSSYPFFPLFPTVTGGLIKVGVPNVVALVGVSWIASFAAVAGAHRLAVRHLPADTAPWATWFLALSPGAVTMAMGYSDSLYLAGAVWALVLVEDRRWWLAGVLGAVATASRPNGWIAVAAVVVTVLLARAGWKALVAVVAPSAAFGVVWCWYLWSVTGDPLVFYTAKEAWDEVTIGSLVGAPLSGDHSAALFHLLCALALAVPWLMRLRRQPPAWSVLVVLGLLPPLVLGLEGVARYAMLAFAMPFAAADVLAGRSRTLAVAALLLSVAALFALASLVIHRTWLP
jgi:hypothetical protein